MNYINRNLIFWLVVLIGAWSYHHLINPIEVNRFLLAFLIIVAIIEVNSSLRYIEEKYLEGNSSELEGKDRL